MRPAIGATNEPNALSASWTDGTSAAAKIATTPTTAIALVADEVRIAPCVPRVSASSSVVRASDRARPDAATVRRARLANGVRSIGPGMSTAAAIASAENGTALRASVQRVPPRAMETTRQRNASPSRPNITMRERTEKPSGSRIRSDRPQAAAAARVMTMIVALRRSPPISRRTVARSSPVPKRMKDVDSTGSGSRPTVNTCARAASAVKVTASTKQRAPMRSASAPLDRTPQLRVMERVDRHAARDEMCRHVPARWHDAEREHTVVRTPESEDRAREPGEDLRRHDDERRTPRDPAALGEEHRLGRVHGVWPEAREDLEATCERARSSRERRAWPFVGEIVEAVRDEP